MIRATAVILGLILLLGTVYWSSLMLPLAGLG